MHKNRNKNILKLKLYKVKPYDNTFENMNRQVFFQENARNPNQLESEETGKPSTTGRGKGGGRPTC